MSETKTADQGPATLDEMLAEAARELESVPRLAAAVEVARIALAENGIVGEYTVTVCELQGQDKSTVIGPFIKFAEAEETSPWVVIPSPELKAN